MFALADCNNFFASCERVFRPDLQGKPVIVLSSNDGCAIARSNEAKALGIFVVSNNFGSAAESITENVDGNIVSITNGQMLHKIIELIDAHMHIDNNMQKHNSTQQSILSSIYDIL